MRRLALSLSALASLFSLSWAADLDVGPVHVRVEALKPGLFCLTESLGAPERPASIFTDPALARARAGTEVDKDGWRGVSVDGQELAVEKATGAWELRAGGMVLARGTVAREEKGALALDLALPAGAPFRAYGAGGGGRGEADALLKTEGLSRLGNGKAAIPYYWSAAGYGALGVAEVDDAPARWAADAQKVRWTFPGRTASLYLFPAADLAESCRRYAALSGAAPVPPRWTFGYLQSRWGWKDPAYVDETLKTFRLRRLPVDAFIFDFECYTATPDYELPPEGAPRFGDFSWNPSLFPDPAAQIAAYAKEGVRVIPIRKPRIGDAETLAMLREKKWIRAAGGNGEKSTKADLRGLDFENPAARAWYAAQLEPMTRDGVAGWWNDEGESIYTKYYWWNEAEREAWSRARPHERFWSLNRSFSPGLQRLGAAAWTGDIFSTWPALAVTPVNLLNWSLAGMPYAGCDIGGFPGRPSPEMLARWMEAGALLPVMRSHSARKVPPHFPWAFGEEAEEAMRGALDLRYRLIPYLYSLAHEAWESGLPLLRPVAMLYPGDAEAADLSDEWFLGPGLLAAPVLAPGTKRSVYFPERLRAFEEARELPAGRAEVDAALDQIPLYVRPGTILPLGPVVQTTADLPGGPLTVEVYAGKDAAFTLVEDDGATDGYLSGAVRKTRFTWDEARRTLGWVREGSYDGPSVFRRVRAVVYGAGGKKESPEADLGPSGSFDLAQ
ncbi:MAG: glycoside hydrolase family 31 protein [Verrucomicrobium sp.]|nr:glycoside hydrolase family 31 protein [Verrucomicrobium sp.]